MISHSRIIRIQWAPGYCGGNTEARKRIGVIPHFDSPRSPPNKRRATIPINPLSRQDARSSVSFRLLSLAGAIADRSSIGPLWNPPVASASQDPTVSSRRGNMSWIFYRPASTSMFLFIVKHFVRCVFVLKHARSRGSRYLGDYRIFCSSSDHAGLKYVEQNQLNWLCSFERKKNQRSLVRREYTRMKSYNRLLCCRGEIYRSNFLYLLKGSRWRCRHNVLIRFIGELEYFSSYNEDTLFITWRNVFSWCW